MRHLILALLLSCATLYACSTRDSVRERGPGDIENALEIIESRREAEYAVISSQEREIRQLEENMEKVKTEGMREKLASDILMKRTTINRARKNIANQDTVLFRLRQKLDSLRSE